MLRTQDSVQWMLEVCTTIEGWLRLNMKPQESRAKKNPVITGLDLKIIFNLDNPGKLVRYKAGVAARS